MKAKDSEKQMKEYYRVVMVSVFHRGNYLEQFNNTDEALEYIGEHELRGAKLIYQAEAYENESANGMTGYAEGNTFREACSELKKVMDLRMNN